MTSANVTLSATVINEEPVVDPSVYVTVYLPFANPEIPSFAIPLASVCTDWALLFNVNLIVVFTGLFWPSSTFTSNVEEELAGTVISFAVNVVPLTKMLFVTFADV